MGYHTQNCSTTDTDITGVENLGKFCFGCNTQFMPFNITNKYVCIDKSYLNQRLNGFTADANCTAYEFTADRTMVCRRCANGWFLRTDTNACVDGVNTTCDGAKKPFVFYIDSTTKKIQKNICSSLINAALTDCLSYVTSYT